MRQSIRLAGPAICLLLATLIAPPCISAATFTVNSIADTVDAAPGDGLCADSNGNCTLRAAVQETNALAGADTIVLGPGIYLLTIPGNSEQNAATGDLDITGPLTITGAGAGNTIIDANGLDRIFEVINAGNVSISGVTLQNGIAGQNQSGYFIQQAGGAIFHVGTPSVLTLNEIVIRNCAATTGGAVYNIYSTLVVRNSTFYNNSATAGGGGAIAEGLADYVQLYNTTLSGNRATVSGGALQGSNNAAILNNVTIVDNIADSDNNGSGDGGGIFPGAAPVLSNTIVARNSDLGGQAPDCAGSITSSGYNLIGLNTGCTITANTGDVIGTVSSPSDPHLSALIDNGGPTPTHAILNFSPALDSGSPAMPGSGNGACEPTDQRGIDRTANAPCDKGAFEHVPLPPLNLTVNSTLDEVDALPGDRRCETVPGNNVCTLRAAIQEADATIGDDTITVPAGIYLLTIAGGNEAWATSGDLNITDNLTIAGAGAAKTIIDGNGLDRVFDQSYAHFFTISGVTIQNGNAVNNPNTSGLNTVGGGIRNWGNGTTTVNDSVISGNKAVDGGGLYTISNGIIVLNRTTVSGNTASTNGGGICNFTFGTTRINDSTIENNRAAYGGGIFNSFRSMATITGSTFNGNYALIGGAVTTQYGQGVVTLRNSTLSGNTAFVAGGGIRISPGDTANLYNVTLVNNQVSSPSAGGGGIYNTSGTVNLSNSLIAGNLDAGATSPDCGGSLNSNGYNLLGDNTGCTINAASGDLVGSGTAPIDPRLGPLTDNGGLTYTHALLPDSPALNAGNPLAPGSGGNACEALDQRGADRTLNANCDIGAVETRLADLGVSQTDSADPVLPGGTVIYTVTVTNNGPDDASDLLLIDSLPTGASLIDVAAGSWSCDGNSPQLSCTLPVLTKGLTSTVSITLSLPGSSGIHTNDVTVSSATLDLNAANDSSSETTVVDAAPVVDGLSDPSYIAGAAAVTLAPAATVSDSDSSTLSSAIIQFTSGYQSGSDLLSFTATATIAGVWNASTGTLTLAGTDSVAAYQDALRRIAFQTDNSAASAGLRAFSITVNDGSFNSTAASGSITATYVPATPAAPSAPTPAPISTDNLAPNIAPVILGSSVMTDAVEAGAPDAAIQTPTAAQNDTAMPAATTDPVTATPAIATDDSGPQASKPDNASAQRATPPARAMNGGPSLAANSNGNAAGFIAAAAQQDGQSRFTTGAVTLSGNTPLWRQLDDMKQQMQGALEERPLQEKIVVGAAKGATLIAFAGTVNWVLKGSNIVAGMLSSLPLWTQFDPLAVLTLTRRERKRRKEQRRADARRDNTEYRQLSTLLERRKFPRDEIRS